MQLTKVFSICAQKENLKGKYLLKTLLKRKLKFLNLRVPTRRRATSLARRDQLLIKKIGK
jgi:hypothetical protein